MASVFSVVNNVLSQGLPGDKSRGPGPLEVEAAQMSGDVDDFSDEK